MDEYDILSDEEMSETTQISTKSSSSAGDHNEVFPGHLTHEVVAARPKLKAFLDDMISRSWDQRKDQKLLDISSLVPFLATSGLGGKPCFDIANVVCMKLLS